MRTKAWSVAEIEENDGILEGASDYCVGSANSGAGEMRADKFSSALIAPA